MAMWECISGSFLRSLSNFAIARLSLLNAVLIFVRDILFISFFLPALLVACDDHYQVFRLLQPNYVMGGWVAKLAPQARKCFISNDNIRNRVQDRMV